MTPTNRRIAILLFKAAVLGLVVYLALRFVDVRRILPTLLSISGPAIGVLFLIASIDRLVMAFKWRYIGRTLGLDLPYVSCLKAYYTSVLVNYLLPTGVGGDVYRGLRLSGEGRGKAPVFATIMMEKVVNAGASLVWAWLGFALLAGSLSGGLRRILFLAVGAATVLGAASVAVSVSQRLNAPAVRLVRRIRLGRVAAAMEKLTAAYAGFSRAKRRYAAATALGLFENAWDYGLYLASAAALHVHVSWVLFLSVIVLNHVARKLILYAHTYTLAEATTVAVYTLAGIPPHQGVAIAIVHNALTVLAALPGAVVFLQERGWRGGDAFQFKEADHR